MHFFSWIQHAFSNLGGPLTIGAVLDQIVDQRHKDSIALYIFGFENRPFRNLESDVIRGLMRIFLNAKDQLVWWRILSWSLFVTVIILLISNLYSDSPPNFIHFLELIKLVTLGVIISIFSFPFDLFSLKITKTIFVDHSPRFPLSAFFIFADMLLSVIPYIVFVIFVQILYLNSFFEYTDLIFAVATTRDIGLIAVVGAVVSIAGSIFISIIQFIVLSISILLRSLMILTRLNGMIALNSQALNFPFTFIGLLLGTILLIIGGT